MVSCHDVLWLVAHLLLHGSVEEGCAMAHDMILGGLHASLGLAMSSGRLVMDKAPHHMADNSSTRVVIISGMAGRHLRANFGFL